MGLCAIVAVILGIEWREHRQRGAQHQRLLDLLDQAAGYQPLQGDQALAQIADRVETVFRFMAMYARQLHLRGALRRHAHPFTIDIVHVVIGMERSNANHQTLDKLLVLITGLPPNTPAFTVQPSNPIARRLSPKGLFDASSPFGQANLVLGRDRPHIQHVLTREVRQLLHRNRDLCVDVTPSQAAFYLHDERVQPDDLDAHIDRCEKLAQAIAHHAAVPMTELERRAAQFS